MAVYSFSGSAIWWLVGGVKGVKFYLRRILEHFLLLFEEFSILLCKIKCCLNLRPIVPLFDDIESFDALTPGHFLVSSNLKSVPQPSVLDITENIVEVAAIHGCTKDSKKFDLKFFATYNLLFENPDFFETRD